MKNQLKVFQKNIIKNLIYFAISLLLGIFFFLGINWGKMLKIQNIFDEITFVNGEFHNQEKIKIPYNYNFIGSISSIQENNSKIDETFENKVKNFLSYVYALGGNFSKASENLNDDNRIYYYNLGNINLFKASKEYGTGNVKTFEEYKKIYNDLNDSVFSYNTGALLLGTGDDDIKKIINNRGVAYQLRFLVGADACVDTYKQMFGQFDEIIKKIDNIINITKKAIKRVNEVQAEFKDLKDPKLIDCMKNTNRALNEYLISFSNLRDILQSYKNKLIYEFSGMVLDPPKCFERLDSDFVKITSANNEISTGAAGYGKVVNDVLDKFQKIDKKGLIDYCEPASSSQDQNQNLSQNINDGLSKLEDTLGDQKKQPQQNDQQNGDGKKQQEKQDGKENKDNNQEQKGSSETPQHTDLPQGYEKQIMDQLEQNSKGWINQMNKSRADPNYNLKDYINQLFQDFYGNQKDFTDQKGGTGAQYNNGY